MIKIPEEGLRIWICRWVNQGSQLRDLIIPKSKCDAYTKYLCKLDCKPCDAQSYRLVKEKAHG